jgi:hypothetical protein
MAQVRTELPRTGDSPATHADARRKDAHGAAALLDVAQQKARAATLRPTQSDDAVARAKRERWSDGSARTLHTPRQ